MLYQYRINYTPSRHCSYSYMYISDKAPNLHIKEAPETEKAAGLPILVAVIGL